MSLQTTARPKTSAGNRAVSARGFRRPVTSSQQNLLEKRPSRATTTPDAGVSELPASRSGLVSQAGLTSRRISSQMSTERRSRLATTSTVVAPPHTSTRPVTKQGLVGVRPSSRAPTTLNRQIMDKSYYMSLLRAKMNNLVAEIDSLKREVEKGEQDRQDLIIYEKRAEEEAETLQKLHGRLIDLNVVVDQLHKNMDSTELENELKELRNKNDILEQTANEMFAERKERESEIQEVENVIESQKLANESAQNNMDSRMRIKIEEVKTSLEQINEEYRLKNDELLDLTAKKEALDEELANSSLKRRAIDLYEQLAEIEAKRETIVHGFSEESSPEEQRQQLLQAVTRTSGEIDIIEKQLETTNEKILQRNEEIREFDTHFENIAGEKSAKYRELKLMEMQYDEFLSNFDDCKAKLENTIAEASNSVVRYLTKISLNCYQLDDVSDVTEMDINSIRQMNDGVLSAPELQQLHVRLQEEMITLSRKEETLRNEIEVVKHSVEETEHNMNDFKDLEGLKKNIENKRKELENRQEVLEQKLPEMEKFYSEITMELSSVNSQLNNNVKYQKLKEAERKLHTLMQRRNCMKDELTKRKTRFDYRTIKEQVMDLKEKYNKALLECLKP